MNRWIWEFPQMFAGFILSRFCYFRMSYSSGTLVYTAKWLPAGVSLGKYILLNRVTVDGVDHEYGHTKQSQIFGPLYLIVVGLPSLIRNIWDRVMHRNWTYHRRQLWYYSGYPERWADVLGDVRRF